MAKTILIVDDSATMILSVKSTLDMAGFQVETARDGLLALKKLQEGLKPDLIITDVNMPNLDGISLIRKAREIAKFKFTPILVLTTESQGSKMNEGKEAGATGWIVKPFNADKLLGIVKKVAE